MDLLWPGGTGMNTHLCEPMSTQRATDRDQDADARGGTPLIPVQVQSMLNECLVRQLPGPEDMPLVQSKMAADDTVKAYQIDVDTKDRIVTLSGEADRAVLLARESAGVKRVVSNLDVGR
jgi:hypothetical protein